MVKFREVAMFKPVQMRITPEAENLAKEYLKTHNLGHRSYENGSYDQQLTGKIAEFLVYERLFGELPDVLGEEDEFDGGFDIVYKNHRIDVKTARRTCPMRENYANNIFAMQIKYDCNILMFCSHNINDNYIEICGWVFKNELKDRAIFHKKGEQENRDDKSIFTYRQDTYTISCSNLRPFVK